MRILGVETSCDETAVCLLECAGTFGADFNATLLGNALFSQASLHAPYGGVFPNLAKREHQKNLVPLLTQALTECGELHTAQNQPIPEQITEILIREDELQKQLIEFLSTHSAPRIDAIAVTFGPGLEPALWPGINFARALSVAWNVPLVAVNHMEGHIVASLVEMRGEKLEMKNEVRFPAVALLVSGGHTELHLVKGLHDYQLLGQTRDDAAGEAFDKIARLLELPYPGGPEISRLANIQRKKNTPHTISLPRPMLDSGDYDFSFSGLKTATRKCIEMHQPLTDEARGEIARETEDAIVETVITKTMRATEEHGAQSIIVGGGVSANTHLKSELIRKASLYGEMKTLFPTKDMATDNAVMIALAGYFRAQKGEYTEIHILSADGNAKLN